MERARVNWQDEENGAQGMPGRGVVPFVAPLLLGGACGAYRPSRLLPILPHLRGKHGWG